MLTSNETLDLSPLPATARREVRDYYEFLLARRRQSGRKATSRNLPAAFDTPIKVKEYVQVSRDEISVLVKHFCRLFLTFKNAEEFPSSPGCLTQSNQQNEPLTLTIQFKRV